MDIRKITEGISPAVSERGCFIVSVKLSADNDIELAVEKEEGVVLMEDCVALSGVFHELFNQDEEDYSLTVTSAGLDQPFKVLKQFLKAVGSEVEVRLKGGKKLTGVLAAADQQGIVLEYSVKEAVEGKKKKELVLHKDSFSFDSINSVVPHIKFD